jgi:amino-acid N-acetyltransferase
MAGMPPPMIDVEIRRAGSADFEAARDLLRASALPVEDLSGDHMDHFLIASIGEAVVGVIGLEAFSGIGLLRSLATRPDVRNAGIGRGLVAELEAMAGRQGLQELWLLTIDADRFFEKQGYRVRQRDEAPDAIRRTAEFSTLCPGDAVLMSKSI